MKHAACWARSTVVAAIVLIEPGNLDAVTIPRLANYLGGALAARTTETVHEASNGTSRRYNVGSATDAPRRSLGMPTKCFGGLKMG